MSCFEVLKGDWHQEVTFGRCKDVSHSLGKLGLPFKKAISKIHFVLKRVSPKKQMVLLRAFSFVVSDGWIRRTVGACFR